MGFTRLSSPISAPLGAASPHGGTGAPPARRDGVPPPGPARPRPPGPAIPAIPGPAPLPISSPPSQAPASTRASGRPPPRPPDLRRPPSASAGPRRFRHRWTQHSASAGSVQALRLGAAWVRRCRAGRLVAGACHGLPPQDGGGRGCTKSSDRLGGEAIASP